MMINKGKCLYKDCLFSNVVSFINDFKSSIVQVSMFLNNTTFLSNTMFLNDKHVSK